MYDKSGKHVIGLNKLFSFKVKDGSRMEKSGWIMHEFSLAGVSLVGEREKSNKLVLCVLQRRGSEFRYQQNYRGLKKRFLELCSVVVFLKSLY